MALKQSVRDIMIPIDNYAVIGPEATLQEAIMALRGSYCTVVEKGFCEETGPQTVLVVDTSNALVGVLDFSSLLKVLVPEIVGTLTDRLAALGVSVAFAEAGVGEMDESHEGVAGRVVRNAQIKVKAVMRKNLGHIQADARVIEALQLMFRHRLIMLPVYEGEKLVGVVRDADLFLTVSDMVMKSA